jgi:molecular chaperone GrpE
MKKKVDEAEVVVEEVVEVEAKDVEEVVEEAAEEIEEQKTLEEELEEARDQAAEYLDGWQRTQAEFSNYKKRQGADRAQMIALANATLLRKLLPIMDDFERAMMSMPSNLSQLTWCEGVFMIKYKLDAVLESEGVQPIQTGGQAFDPHYHEAVTYEEVPGYEDGQIIGEVQRGYTLDERVLRPALVRVAKALAAPEPEPPEE